MRKSFSVILLSAAVALALSACGGAAQSAPSAPPAAAGSANAAPDSSSAAQAVQPDFLGDWEVRDFQAAEVSALSEEEAQAYRGVRLSYQEEAVLCGGEAVAAGPVYQEEGAYTYDTLLEEYRANLGEWWNGIGEARLVEAAPDGDFFGNRFFVADAETIWIYYEGVFFLAKRA